MEQAIRDKDNNNMQLYLNFAIVRDLKAVKNLYHYKATKLVMTNCDDFGQLITRIEEVEKKHARKYEENSYKARYGSVITFLYPQNADKSRRLSILNKFIKLFLQKENLPYVAFERTLGKAVYAIVYFYDREYSNEKILIRYKRNLYINKKTNKFTNGFDPEAILVRKKGEKKLDESGNPIYETNYFSTLKTRLFVYVSSFEAYVGGLKKLFIIALETSKITYKKGKFFRKIVPKVEYNYFVKRAIAETNRVKCFMEHELTDALQRCYEYPSDFLIHKGYDPDEPILNKQGKAIERIYYKYRERFKKGSFKNEKNEVCKIAYTRLDIIRNNLGTLYSMFKKELQEVCAC